ncbi:MAG: flagellar brake protein [Candidatus Glassbacteria bacterium]
MDDSFRDILRGMQLPHPSTEDVTLFIITILASIGLIVLAGVLHSFLNKLREHKSLLKAAKQHGLTRNELELITKIAAGRTRIKPSLVFISIREFHRLFGPLMHDLVSKSEHDAQARRQLDGVFALRKKLFGEVAYHFGNITSTIQLKIGQSVTLQFSFNNRTYSFTSAVLDVDAHAITVVNPSYRSTYFLMQKDHPVKVSFNRSDDGYYEFETHTLREVLKKDEYFLVLAHADKIKRMQSRMFFRVSCSIPIRYRRFAWNEDPESRYHPGTEEVDELSEGKVVDIGGGGLLVITGRQLYKNDLLTFDLPLSEENQMSDVLGKVVRIEERGIEKNLWNVHLQFLNLKSGEQDLIIRLIQQNKISGAAAAELEET